MIYNPSLATLLLIGTPPAVATTVSHSSNPPRDQHTSLKWSRTVYMLHALRLLSLGLLTGKGSAVQYEQPHDEASNPTWDYIT